jgi:hypothetical protein
MAKEMAQMELSPEVKERFDMVHRRAKELGVLDINFSGPDSDANLACYERTLDIIEKNKVILDKNAGDMEV